MRNKSDKIKKVLCIALVLITANYLCACGSATDTVAKNREEGKVYTFTDSCSRDVEVPENITRVAPSGSVAQMVLMTIAPETLVGLSSTPSMDQYPYFPEEMIALPTFGQFYGSKANLNMEAMIAAEPQIIIDIGDKKIGHSRDMNKIQRQTGVPTIFVEADIDDLPEAYRTLGKLLGKEEKGEELASYIEDVLYMAELNRNKLKEKDIVSVMYGTGSTGLNTNAKGSVQADVLEVIGVDNAIVTEEEVSHAGGATLVSMEEVYRINPDIVLLATGGPYKRITAGKSEWDDLQAVKNGTVYEVPNLPYSWMSSPPSVNRVIGVIWLGNLLYPELYDYDMVEEAKEFYRLFWNYELSDEEAVELLSKSTFKDK